MTPPLKPRQIKELLRKFDVSFHGNLGWETHDRNGHGAFSDINGVMIHHTGDDAKDDLDFRVLWNGRSDLPGPLCHVGIRDNGVVELMSAGRANHAGMGDGRVLGRVIAEDYGTAPPPPVRDNVDGNARFYGAELMYSGTHKPTDMQLESAVRWAAAICHGHGWTEKSVIGHKEWTRRKVDPGNVSMSAFRILVKAELAKHD